MPDSPIRQWQDATERQLAEESQRFLQSTLDALSSHIAILDGQGTIIEVNRAWKRFAEENELATRPRGVGDNYLRVCDTAVGLASEEASVVAEGIRAVMAGRREEFHLEYPCHSPREQRWFMVRVTRFGGGGPVRAVVAHENVTERKLAELKIEQLNADLEQKVADRTASLSSATREAERASNAKGDFLSRISHELRTPMNVILGFGQLLEMEEQLGPDARESIGQILQAGRHLLILINEMLDLASAESGNLSLSTEPVEVEPLLEETLKLVRPLALPLGIGLPAPTAAECPWVVLADRVRLKQVLLSLLSNAIKYNRPGGMVTIECAPTELAHLLGLRLWVKDTGLGISAEKLARLFTPFDRLDAERSRTHIAGTGLGLAVAKQLMELMGGRLGVQSVAGEGSSFWLDLPLAERPR